MGEGFIFGRVRKEGSHFSYVISFIKDNYAVTFVRFCNDDGLIRSELF